MTGDSTSFDALADYQARLLELLYTNDSPTADDVRTAAGPYADALGELDPVLLKVAATLTKTWGRIS